MYDLICFLGHSLHLMVNLLWMLLLLILAERANLRVVHLFLGHLVSNLLHIPLSPPLLFVIFGFPKPSPILQNGRSSVLALIHQLTTRSVTLRLHRFEISITLSKSLEHVFQDNPIPFSQFDKSLKLGYAQQKPTPVPKDVNILLPLGDSIIIIILN